MVLKFVKLCSGETEIPFGRVWLPYFGLVVGSAVARLFRFFTVAKRNGGGVTDNP